VGGFLRSCSSGIQQSTARFSPQSVGGFFHIFFPGFFHLFSTHLYEFFTQILYVIFYIKYVKPYIYFNKHILIYVDIFLCSLHQIFNVLICYVYMLTLLLVSTPYTLLTLSGASHINIKFLLLDSFSNTLKQLNEIGKTYLNEELQYLADNQLFLEKSIPQPPPNMRN